MNANFRGKGRPPPTNLGIRKLQSLGYRMVKKIAEKFNRLSRVHQRRRQQTDGIAMASSEREREFPSAKKRFNTDSDQPISTPTKLRFMKVSC